MLRFLIILKLILKRRFINRKVQKSFNVIVFFNLSIEHVLIGVDNGIFFLEENLIN